MILRRRGLLARSYGLTSEIWEGFRGRPYDLRYFVLPQHIDLCTLVRTVFVLMPLAVTVNLAALGFAGFALWRFLFSVYLNFSVYGIFTLIVAAAISVLLLICFLVYGGSWLWRTARDAEVTEAAKLYYRSAKDRYCPILELEP